MTIPGHVPSPLESLRDPKHEPRLKTKKCKWRCFVRLLPPRPHPYFPSLAFFRVFFSLDWAYQRRLCGVAWQSMALTDRSQESSAGLGETI